MGGYGGTTYDASSCDRAFAILITCEEHASRVLVSVGRSNNVFGSPTFIALLCHGLSNAAQDHTPDMLVAFGMLPSCPSH